MTTNTIPVTHLIRAKYLGPTNTKPSRVKLISGRDASDHVTFDFDQRSAYTIDQAAHWLREHGYTVRAHGELSDSEYGVMVDEFMSLRTARDAFPSPTPSA